MKLYEVIKNRLYGSSLPLSEEEYFIWKDFDSIVSLTEHYRLNFLIKQKYENDFNVLKSPIPDFEAPELSQAIHICTWIQNELMNNKKVIVHCLMGRGRTGTILACYLMKYHNLSAEEALIEIRKKNPEAIETSSQEKFLYIFAKTLET